ncbi:MAG: sulfotransferase family protein [Phycisphaerales bacterium]
MPLPDNRFVNLCRAGLEYAGLSYRIAPFPIRRLARPWRRDELPQAPGRRTAPPDFVGIGTQKSGTSWWASLIEEHPEVTPNLFNRKEMHYFTHFFETPMTDEAIEAYHAAFARPEGQLCGEWTPNYMASPYTMALLRRAAPDARLLVLVRDPVDRYASGFNHELKQRYGGVIGPAARLRVIKKYALRKESIWNGMYAAQMDIVLRHFPRERVLVLQYEQCRSKPEAMIRKTYAFLGIDPDFSPAGIDRAVNVQRRVTAPLADSTRRLLADVYVDDAKRLAERFPDEIDLDLWTELNDAA